MYYNALRPTTTQKYMHYDPKIEKIFFLSEKKKLYKVHQKQLFDFNAFFAELDPTSTL